MKRHPLTVSNALDVGERPLALFILARKPPDCLLALYRCLRPSGCTTNKPLLTEKTVQLTFCPCVLGLESALSCITPNIPNTERSTALGVYLLRYPILLHA